MIQLIPSGGIVGYRSLFTEEPYIASGAQIAEAAPHGVKVVFATFQNIAKDYPWPLSWFERRSPSPWSASTPSRV